MLTYRFVSEQLHDGSFAHRPKITVTFIGPKASMDFLALIDSGADITIIPRSIADFLGIPYDFKSKERFYGFGKESFQCASSTVDIVFRGSERQQDEKLVRVPVLVTLSGEEKEPVLGHTKIFDSFIITFIQGHTIQMSKPS